MHETQREIRIRYSRESSVTECLTLGTTGPGPVETLPLNSAVGSRTIVLELPPLSPTYRRTTCDWVADAITMTDQATSGKGHPSLATITALLEKRPQSLSDDSASPALLFSSFSVLEEELRLLQSTEPQEWGSVPRGHLGVARALRFIGLPTERCHAARKVHPKTSSAPALWAVTGQFGQANIATLDTRFRPTAFAETAHEIIAADLCPDGTNLATLQNGSDTETASYASYVQFINLRTMQLTRSIDLGVPSQEVGSIVCGSGKHRTASVSLVLGPNSYGGIGDDIGVGYVADNTFTYVSKVIGYRLHLTRDVGYYVNASGTLNAVDVHTGETRVGPRVAPPDAGTDIDHFLSPKGTALAAVADGLFVHKVDGMNISPGRHPDLNVYVGNRFRIRWIDEERLLITGREEGPVVVNIDGSTRVVPAPPAPHNPPNAHVRFSFMLPAQLQQQRGR